MTTNILTSTVEIRIVFRGGWYFYNRIRAGVEEVACESITAERAREIYDNNQDGRNVVEGEPFNERGEAWAWSAWVEL